MKKNNFVFEEKFHPNYDYWEIQESLYIDELEYRNVLEKEGVIFNLSINSTLEEHDDWYNL